MNPVSFCSEFSNCSDDIRATIATIASEAETDAIWFIGSRANGRAKPSSDWDILVFARNQISEVPSRCPSLDVLRVDPSGNALLEGQTEFFSQPFARFRWVRNSKERASYSGQRFLTAAERDGRDQPVELSQCEAILLYERDGG